MSTQSRGHDTHRGCLIVGNMTTKPSEPILLRIDREIEALLRAGRLSPLDYDLPASQLAKTNRAANLKALLTARRHYRELLNEPDES
jgi:hypothetical protein